jgi:hypothetical protein
VTDLAGRMIRTEQISAHLGLNRYNMNMGDVMKGMYLFSLTDASGKRMIIRVGVE